MTKPNFETDTNYIWSQSHSENQAGEGTDLQWLLSTQRIHALNQGGLKRTAQAIQAERDIYTSQAGRTEAWERMGLLPAHLYLSHLSARCGLEWNIINISVLGQTQVFTRMFIHRWITVKTNVSQLLEWNIINITVLGQTQVYTRMFIRRWITVKTNVLQLLEWNIINITVLGQTQAYTCMLIHRWITVKTNILQLFEMEHH